MKSRSIATALGRRAASSNVPNASEVLPHWPGLPEVTPIGNLPKPEVHRSVLAASGLRVASIETYGQLCNFGVFVDAGSRCEVPGEAGSRGATHLTELMAFKSTHKRSAEDMHLEVAAMGGTTQAFSSRDLVMYNVEVLREHLGPAMELLSDTLLQPKFDPLEVDEMKSVMGMIADQPEPALLLREGLHAAAFGEHTPVGQSHACPAELLAHLGPQSLAAYQQAHVGAPRMVLVGAGVDHAEFTALAEEHFAPLPKTAGSSGVANTGGMAAYSGGEHRLPSANFQGPKAQFCHVALSWMSSWEVPKDRVPICVLQHLLGGGNSFSAGGPGKGMYSRLYREVLNRYHDVETAEAHVEASGLMGVIGACHPDFAEKLTYTMAEQMARIAFSPISDEELSRARNMLKCNVLTCLESHHMVFEDIGQQLIYDDDYLTPIQVCAMIDAVTAEDLARVAQQAIMLGPSLASCGPLTSTVPSIEKVRGWFAKPA